MHNHYHHQLPRPRPCPLTFYFILKINKEVNWVLYIEDGMVDNFVLFFFFWLSANLLLPCQTNLHDRDTTDNKE